MNLSKEQVSGIKSVFNEYNVCFAYLYGSRANRTENKKSDYDFAVYFNDKISSNKRYEARLKITNKLSGIIGSIEQVDLVVLNDIKSVLFKFTVIKEGEIVHEKEHDQRVLFELNSMNQYYDYLPFLNLYNKALIERALTE